MSSSSPAAAGTPYASSSSSSSPRTPFEDRLSKRLKRKNAKGETHLHRAAIKGNWRFAERMLRLGLDPNEADNAGWTPLHEACNRGSLSVVRVLVRHGADVNRFGGQGEQRETPLHDAAKMGHLKVGQAYEIFFKKTYLEPRSR